MVRPSTPNSQLPTPNLYSRNSLVSVISRTPVARESGRFISAVVPEVHQHKRAAVVIPKSQFQFASRSASWELEFGSWELERNDRGVRSDSRGAFGARWHLPDDIIDKLDGGEFLEAVVVNSLRAVFRTCTSSGAAKPSRHSTGTLRHHGESSGARWRSLRRYHGARRSVYANDAARRRTTEATCGFRPIAHVDR
jgi:hypothetical protein